MARWLKPSPRTTAFILIFLALPLVAEVVSIAAQQAGVTKHDLAYYLDVQLIDFVRPGLVAKITSANIQDGRITVRFKLTDPKGLPLDRDGVTTPGAVSTSFISAYIPNGEKQYTAYTTRLVTSPITNKSAVQASTDSGGTYGKVGDGEYTYTFLTTVPVKFDSTATHSIGMYASRNLSEFNLGTQYDDDVYTFVPNGSKPSVVRDVARTENCNKCHDPLAMHGERRRSVELCVLCHTPQTTDPDTGNTVDLKVMVHKIHMGKDLPSVQAGTPYKIIGFNQSVHDFSTVAFPNQIRNCELCHTGGTQSGTYLTAPSRAACGSCHDTVNFATGEGHVNLPQVSDNLCANCHIPQGELEFDASIKGAHTIPQFSQQLPGTTFSILKVENTGRGQKPTVTFTIKDKKGNVIEAASMGYFSLVMAGPTTDYRQYWREDARAARRVGDEFIYTFTNAIPEDATGTFAMAMEGYKSVLVNAGTKKEMTVRDAGFNPVVYFGVTDRIPVPRRKVAALENCATCHGTPFIAVHGTVRRNIPELCVFCHNPNETDVARRTPETMPPESIHFKTMIHKIHTGEDLKVNFSVFRFNYNEVRYPGDRRNCNKCHVPDSYQLPLAEDLLPSQAPRDYINPMQPTTAACLSCHTDKPSAAHAAVMTSPTLGESCAACHGRNNEFSLDRVHAR